MDEGDGLENRRAKAPWVRILPPPPLNYQNLHSHKRQRRHDIKTLL